MKDLFEEINERVEKFGWTSVFADRSKRWPAFSHTVGFSEKGRSDFLIIGFEVDVVKFIFYRLAEMDGLDAPLRPGRYSRIIQDLDVELVSVKEAVAAELASVCVRRMHGVIPSLLQVVLPDPSGLLPGDDGLDIGYFDGQMLGKTLLAKH